MTLSPGPPDPAPLSPGELVAHYRVLAEIGRGGTGFVYRAHDEVLGREVALKTLRPEAVTDPDARRRFLREPKAASRISHPNVIAIHEVFEWNNLPWIAMQLVDGPSLRTILLERGRLSIPDLLRYAEDLTRALESAHEKHVVHRDVNPNNILVHPEGRVMLGDFGIAGYFTPPGSPAGTHSPSSVTEGAFVGTAQYMSPEQALGRSLDGRSDLFSLGAVLYEIATGRMAFGATEFSRLLDDILHHEPEPISRHTYEVPPALETMIRKLLRKEAEERYQSTREVLADIAAVRREMAGSPQLRRPRVILKPGWIGAALGLALLGGGWLARDQWRVGPRPLPRVTAVRVTSEPGPEEEPALSPDGREIAFSGERNGNADIWIVDAAGGPAEPLTNDPAAEYSPTWFPDGGQVAFATNRDGPMAIWRIARRGGAPSLVLSSAMDPAISPDGVWIAFARAAANQYMRIGVAPLADTSQVRILTTEANGLWNHRAPAFSPDGRYLCYEDHTDLWIVPVKGGTPRQVTEGGHRDSDPAWSSDGRFIYFGSERGAITGLWRVDPKNRVTQGVTFGTGSERHPSIAMNAASLACATSTTTENLVIVDAATGERHRLVHDSSDFFPAMAPDGRSVVYASDRWGKQDLWRQALDNGVPVGEPVRLTDHPGGAAHPVYSTDGRWLAYYRILEGQRDIWTLPAGGGTPIQVTDDPAPDYHPAFSPDGRRMVFVSQRPDGRARLWSIPLENGRPAGPADSLTTVMGGFLSPDISPDGATVAVVVAQQDVLVIPLNGGPSRRLSVGGNLMRLRWASDGASLLISGVFDGRLTCLRQIRLEDGSPMEASIDFCLGVGPVMPEFDLTPDGRWLVLSSTERRGDVWLLSAAEGRF